MSAGYRLRGIVRRYRGARGQEICEALRLADLDMAAGEIVAVVGPNGSGKSTLLEVMAFLHRPDEGQILLDGADVWAEGRGLAARRRCAMLLQKTVLFRTTVLKNVAYGLRLRGMGRVEIRRRTAEVLERLALGDLADRSWRELSGGQQQRVALARLLVLEPEVLLLDEPTSQVDSENQQIIETVLREQHAARGTTIILASHDHQQAAALADRVVALSAGRVVDG